MPARVLPATPQAIAEAAEVIRRGGLVAFPTETVYGLGADALDEHAVRRIFEAKGRPADDPVIVHLARSADLPRVAREHGSWRLLADRFWPGPLTLVLPRASAVPLVVTAGGETVAVRVPAHAVARTLILAAATPIAAPSANLYARPSPTTAEHVLHDLGNRIDLILDGGPAEVGVESTVLDLTGDRPTILRPGGVTAEQLREVIDVAASAGRGQDPRSPGTAERHYSPRARVDLFEGATPDQLEAHISELERRGQRVARLRLPDSPAEAAHNLYAALRQLDASGPDAIVANLPPEGGLATALRDRLHRAASGRILDTPIPD
jgi:L-threonylcarbamoyladenylate synthase